MAKVIGIDLGMTNSCVAVKQGEQTVVIANAEGYRFTPCVVAYGNNGVSEAGSKSDRLVGQHALRKAVMMPENTFYGVKRFIGQRYDEHTDEAARVPYQVLTDSHGQVKLSCPNVDQEFSPQEISAILLQKLKQDAENFLGEPVEYAVITVPVHFSDSQRQATKDAGTIAGLNVLRIINEPTAACLAYGLDKSSEERIILVFDLGGSTLDVSILELGDGVSEVKVSSKDLHLGGNDFDKKIVDWLVDEFQQSEGIDLREDRQAMQRITEAAEKAKIDLCGVNQVEIHLPFIAATQEGPKHLDTTLSRTEFEQMCSDLLKRCRLAIEQALKDFEYFCNEVNEVVLVGGSTRIPAIQELVRQMTGKEPCRGMNPDEVVVIGAAMQGSVLDHMYEGCCISYDMTPLSLGIETLDGITSEMIPQYTFLPTINSAIFSTATDGQTSVEINIVQGQRALAKDNRSLGTLHLNGIIPAPRGIPQIKVTFEIDCNGFLKVSAQDKGTGKEQSIQIVNCVLSNSEVERMMRDAEIHAAADCKILEPIRASQTTAALINEAGQQLQELGQRVSAMEELLKNLRETIDKSGCDRTRLLSSKPQPFLIQTVDIKST
jgi:molecular chaperone DnaK